MLVLNQEHNNNWPLLIYDNVQFVFLQFGLLLQAWMDQQGRDYNSHSTMYSNNTVS